MPSDDPYSRHGHSSLRSPRGTHRTARPSLASHRPPHATTTTRSSARTRLRAGLPSHVDHHTRPRPLALQSAPRCAPRPPPHVHHHIRSRPLALQPAPDCATTTYDPDHSHRRALGAHPQANRVANENETGRPIPRMVLSFSDLCSLTEGARSINYGVTMNFIGHTQSNASLRIVEAPRACDLGYWGQSLPCFADSTLLEGKP